MSIPACASWGAFLSGRECSVLFSIISQLDLNSTKINRLLKNGRPDHTPCGLDILVTKMHNLLQQSITTYTEKRKSQMQNSEAHVVMVSLNCQKFEVKMAEAALENGVFCCIKYFLISFEVVNIYQGQYPPPHWMMYALIGCWVWRT